MARSSRLPSTGAPVASTSSARTSTRGRHVGGEVVAHPGVRDGQARRELVAWPVPTAARDELDLNARFHHFPIVNATPDVAAVRHVTVLALLSAARRRARSPFFEGVLEQLAVQREAVRGELVAACAELGAQEGRRPGQAVVREALARSAGRRRAVPPRWTEALMAAHVAARADHALRLQIGVQIRVGDEPLIAADQRGLLGEGRVACEAGTRRGGVTRDHLGELPGDAWTHALRVKAGSPVPELDGMTGPARRGGQGALDRREARGRLALGCERAPPVLTDEVLLRARSPPAFHHRRVRADRRRRARGARSTPGVGRPVRALNAERSTRARCYCAARPLAANWSSYRRPRSSSEVASRGDLSSRTRVMRANRKANPEGYDGLFWISL